MKFKKKNDMYDSFNDYSRVMSDGLVSQSKEKLLSAIEEFYYKISKEENYNLSTQKLIIKLYNKYLEKIDNPYLAILFLKYLIDKEEYEGLVCAMNEIIDKELLHENKLHRSSLLKVINTIFKSLCAKYNLNNDESEYLLLSIKLSFKYPGIVGDPINILKLKEEVAIDSTRFNKIKDIVSNQNLANSDGLNLKYLISQMKGGISVDLGLGCPLGCAYCYRIEGEDFEKYKQRWMPKNFISEEESINRLINHPWFTPHITPIGLHMSTTEAFIPQVFPSTIKLLQLLDKLGLTNRVSIITKYTLNDEQIDILNSFKNIDLDICVCYSGMKKSIEPSSNIKRMDFLKKLQSYSNINSIGYYRPIIEGYNTHEDDIRQVLTNFKKTGVKTIVIGGLKFAKEHEISFMSQGLPLPSNSFESGKKYLSKETIDKIKRIYDEIFSDCSIQPQLFRRSSCSRVAVRGGYIADYNAHYTNRERNCSLSCSQHERCSVVKQPSEDDVRAVLQRICKGNLPFQITGEELIVNGKLSMFEKTFMMQNLYFPVMTDIEYCKKLYKKSNDNLSLSKKCLINKIGTILKNILNKKYDKSVLEEIVNIQEIYYDDNIVDTLIESHNLNINMIIRLIKFNLKANSYDITSLTNNKLINYLKEEIEIIGKENIFNNENNILTFLWIFSALYNDDMNSEKINKVLNEESFVNFICMLDESLIKELFKDFLDNSSITNNQMLLVEKILNIIENTSRTIDIINFKEQFIEKINTNRIDYIKTQYCKLNNELVLLLEKSIGYRNDLIKNIFDIINKNHLRYDKEFRIECHIIKIIEDLKEINKSIDSYNELVEYVELLLQRKTVYENTELYNAVRHILQVIKKTKLNQALEKDWENLWENKDEKYQYDGVIYSNTQKVLLTAYYMINLHIKDEKLNIDPTIVWGTEEKGRNLVHFIAEKMIYYKDISVINQYDDVTIKSFYQNIYKIKEYTLNTHIHLSGLISSIKSARSKNIIDNINHITKVGIVVPMWNEKEKMCTYDQNSNGQDALRVKIEQIKWLYNDNIFVRPIISFIDDADPLKSGICASTILLKEYSDLYALDNSKDIRVYMFGDIVDKNNKLPIEEKDLMLTGISDANKDESKGGCVQWLMYQMAKEGIDYILYIDFDLTCQIEQCGILLDKLIQGKSDMAIGSRKLSSSYGYYNEKGPNTTSVLYRHVINDFLKLNIEDFNVGYKAFTGKSLLKILPLTKDRKLSFDVELALLYSRNGYFIDEVGLGFLHLYIEGKHGCPRDYGILLENVKEIVNKSCLDIEEDDCSIINLFDWSNQFNKVVSKIEDISLNCNINSEIAVNQYFEDIIDRKENFYNHNNNFSKIK